MDNLRGFYAESVDKSKKADFLEELNRCWLYCPDDVITKGYAFLEKVSVGKKYSDDEKELALGEFVVALRKDLMPKRYAVFSRTCFAAKDFQHLRAN